MPPIPRRAKSISAINSLPASPGAWHRRIIHLTWPVLLANVSIPMVGVVDTAVMGQLGAPRYIGAVAIGSQVFSATYWLFGFLRMATTGLVSQSFGAGDADRAIRTIWRAAGLGLGIGLALLAVQWPLELAVLWLFDASAEVEALAAEYFRVRIWGAPALLLQTVMLGVLFGLQKMRATLAVSLLYNGANIGLDVLFVLGFGWEVTGVALATVLSEVLAAVVSVTVVLRTLRSMGWLGPRPSRLWRSGARELLGVSGHLVVRSFFVQLPFFVVTLLSASLGDVTLAANAILMQLFMIMAFAIDGFAHSAEALAGFAYGARARQGLRQATLYCTFWGGLLGLTIAGAFAVFGDAFIAALSTAPEVRALAEDNLFWMVICPLLGVWAFVGDGVFIGTTHVRELRNSMLIAAVVFMLGALSTVETFGNQGLWASFCGFMAVRAIGLALYYPRIERAVATDLYADS